MSDQAWRRNLWGKKGVAKNVAGSLEPEPETVTGTPAEAIDEELSPTVAAKLKADPHYQPEPISDTDDNPFDLREHGGIIPAPASGGTVKERPRVLHVDSHEQFTPGARVRIIDPAVGIEQDGRFCSCGTFSTPLEVQGIAGLALPDQLAADIYRDILGAYWPQLTDVPGGPLNTSERAELFSACASSAVQAADALHDALAEALSSE